MPYSSQNTHLLNFSIVQCVTDIEAWINISLFQEMKVVMLEDLAAHFKLKTQVCDWCG